MDSTWSPKKPVGECKVLHIVMSDLLDMTPLTRDLTIGLSLDQLSIHSCPTQDQCQVYNKLESSTDTMSGPVSFIYLPMWHFTTFAQHFMLFVVDLQTLYIVL